MKTAISIVALLGLILLHFTEARASYPLVRNFTRRDYKGAHQNWAITQHPHGIMFFGNKDALFVFNGASWDHAYLDNYSAVRLCSWMANAYTLAAPTPSAISHQGPTDANFMNKFDSAYDNFTHRVAERFPELTKGDRLMCCYLKMGFSAKDTAPLLNISYRSVEMRRHRLRTKKNLPHEVNFYDFFRDF